MNLFKPTLKALSQALGPIGAPLEFAISAIEDEESEQKQFEIINKIEKGEHITNKILEEVINFKKEFSETNEQFKCAFKILVNSSIIYGWNNNFIKKLESIDSKTIDIVL